MTYSVGMNARMGGLRCLILASATLAAVSCVPQLPEGNLACELPDSPCPPDWHCWPSDQRCHSSTEPRAPQPPSPTDGSYDTEPPDVTPPDTGSMLAAPDVGPPKLPPPPPCVRSKVEDEMDIIFVSPASASGESMADCGSRAHPCASLNRGIALAASDNISNVYLNEGIYPEQVQLRAGITLVGGWRKRGDDWRKYCGDNPESLARIETPTHIGVLAEYDGSATLQMLSVSTKAPAEPGETSYGVFARGATTSLKLERVRIEAANGGDGAASTAAATPEKPALTCAAGAALPAGPVGEPGRVAAAGSFDAGGYHPASGEPGQPGSAGDNAQALTQECKPCVEAGSCASDTDGNCDGTRTGQLSCPTPGAPGCAGLPGRGGDGGPGGGGSIALFAWGAHVNLVESLLIAGDGGKGALGADGSPGGPGGDGAPGLNGEVCSVCARRFDFFDPVLPPIKALPEFAGPQPSAAADPEFEPARDIGTIDRIRAYRCITDSGGATAFTGQAGTPGSAGGRGGDGAGGPSHALFRGGGAVVDSDDATKLAHGKPGVSLGAGATGAASDEAADGPSPP